MGSKLKQRILKEIPDSLWDASPPLYEPCHQARVSLPGNEHEPYRRDGVVGLISLITPVYAIYASHELRDKRGMLMDKEDRWTRFPPFPPEFQEREARLAELIEEVYGFARLPNDVLFTPVPDRVPMNTNTMDVGQAQLVDLIFTHHRF